MKALSFAITSFALAISSVAAAENLIQYSEDVDGTVHYFYSDTVKKVSGGYINVWTTMDASKDKTVKWSSTKVLVKIDCARTNFELLYYVKYDANDRVMDQGSFNSTMQPAVPDTTGYSLVEAVCARYQ